jgi:hypothetical protein
MLSVLMKLRQAEAKSADSQQSSSNSVSPVSSAASVTPSLNVSPSMATTDQADNVSPATSPESQASTSAPQSNDFGAASSLPVQIPASPLRRRFTDSAQLVESGEEADMEAIIGSPVHSLPQRKPAMKRVAVPNPVAHPFANTAKSMPSRRILGFSPQVDRGELADTEDSPRLIGSFGR